MLSSIKSASERQTIINSQKNKLNANSFSNDQTVLINHFESILKNWTDMHTNQTKSTIASPHLSRSLNNPLFDKEISIPVISNINKVKYDEWNQIFTKAGYTVKMTDRRFTVSMP